MAEEHRQRDIQVSPGRNNRDVGTCNGCCTDVNDDGLMKAEKVWLVSLRGSQFRLCQSCMEEFLVQVAWHRTKEHT